MAQTEKDQASLARARAVQKKARTQIGKLAPVSGVGITKVGGQYALKVNLASKPKRGATLPTAIDGVPVRTEVVGAIRPRRAS